MSDNPHTLLGFDYGEKRIGVAVGQTLTGTATPVQTISQYRQQPDWNTIAALIDTWHPDRLVVGLPLNMDGTEQRLTQRARGFARQLAGRYALPVEYADERLSTREAARDLEHRTRPRQGRDALAAQVILEGWMTGAGLGLAVK